MALTAKIVTKLTEPGRYGDGRGLYLQITRTGGKSWLLRYERNGKERAMGLGSIEFVDLEEARNRAHVARRQLKEARVDPIDLRRAEKSEQLAKAEATRAKTITFAECAEQYFNFHSAKWKNEKHRAQFLSTLKTYAYPLIKHLPVETIDKAVVLKVIEPIWYEKTETASRLRGRIEGVLDFAKTRGYRDGENPAAWTGNLVHALPAPNRIAKVAHHAALPYARVSEFMTSLRERRGVAALALEFTILNAARTGEVVGALWSEFDLDLGVWTIPAERMKAKKEHRVALAKRSLKILQSLPKEGNFIFPGIRKDTSISNMAMAELLKRMGRNDITVHGFRSTFRDWAAELTSYPSDVVEMALAHTVKNKVEAAYRRGDLFMKRRKLMEDWAQYCADYHSVQNHLTPLSVAYVNG